MLGALVILAGAVGNCVGQTSPPGSNAIELAQGANPNPSLGPPVLEVGKPLPDAGPRTWGSADYLLWWVRKGGTPPLVVTGSPADPFPGALDQPGTRVLFGDRGLGYGAFNGMRLSLGTWLDTGNTLGIEAGGFVLERRTAQYSARGDANGQPFLGAPFVNAITGNANVYFISQNFADPNLAGMLTGSVGVFSSTSLWNWEIHGVANVTRNDTWTIDVLAGFRQTSLREDLGYVTTAQNITPAGVSTFLTIPIAPAFTVTTSDQFRTTNLFNGGQIGARIGHRWDLATLEVVGKFAMGSMHETVSIQGQTTTNAPLPVTQAVGGIYAQGTNIGNYSRDVFAVIPEVNVNLSMQLTSNIKARVGYTFLYLSNVVRPGDHIDPRINPNQVPIDFGFGTPGGPNRPAFDWRGTGYWAQGINFGLEFTY